MKNTKTGYVDGFVFVVSNKKTAAYKKMATEGKAMWMKAGALDYKECKGNDLNVKSQGGMKPLAFGKLTKAKKGETVWFSYITFKSRAHRDMVNAKVMKMMNKEADKYKDFEMPFNPARMAYGGFTVEIG